MDQTQYDKPLDNLDDYLDAFKEILKGVELFKQKLNTVEENQQLQSKRLQVLERFVEAEVRRVQSSQAVAAKQGASLPAHVPIAKKASKRSSSNTTPRLKKKLASSTGRSK
ncbi:hypothetical protein GGI19_006585 [Coemansia pectinata]|uniref:Uncharacterized protein n=1 Tax=Coemansia pectinata TaxID=1052879 RepID=A0A9W8L8H0_9FUNG|nr:hypothetical protein GGI19_006585 [Coemansia pectinata]